MKENGFLITLRLLTDLMLHGTTAMCQAGHHTHGDAKPLTRGKMSGSGGGNKK